MTFYNLSFASDINIEDSSSESRSCELTSPNVRFFISASVSIIVKTLIAKLRSQNHAVLGVFLLPDQIVTFYRQAETLRFKVPTFGASIHDNQDLIKQAGYG